MSRVLTLNQYAEEIHNTAVEHGWWEADRNVGEVLALIHSEVSEALEEYRIGKSLDEVYYDSNNPDKPEGYPVELADALIRILDALHAAGVDIDEVVQLKMAYNDSRPYRHGGKLA